MLKNLIAIIFLLYAFPSFSQTFQLSIPIARTEEQSKKLIPGKPKIEEKYNTDGKHITLTYPGYIVDYKFNSYKRCSQVILMFLDASLKNEMNKWFYENRYENKSPKSWEKVDEFQDEVVKEKLSVLVLCQHPAEEGYIFQLFDDLIRR